MVGREAIRYEEREATRSLLAKGGSFLVWMGVFLPYAAMAQNTSGGFQGFHEVLDELYVDIIPLCQPLILYARLLAGFAALWFIGYRVWVSLARAEPIDLMGIMRPFVLGFCILIFPQVLDLMNGLLSPLEEITKDMESSSRQRVNHAQGELDRIRAIYPAHKSIGGEAFGDPLPYKPLEDGEAKGLDSGWWAGVKAQVQSQMERASWQLRLSVRSAMGEVLEWMFFAASLCIDLVRSFYLIILSLFGPLVFAFACFDGMGHSVTAWISRYVHVTLWLPVSHIMGSMLSRIQEQMILRDLEALKAGEPAVFSSSDLGYMVFMIMGIVGYCFVPTASGYLLTWGSGGWMHRSWNAIAAQTIQRWIRRSP